MNRCTTTWNLFAKQIIVSILLSLFYFLTSLASNSTSIHATVSTKHTPTSTWNTIKLNLRHTPSCTLFLTVGEYHGVNCSNNYNQLYLSRATQNRSNCKTSGPHLNIYRIKRWTIFKNCSDREACRHSFGLQGAKRRLRSLFGQKFGVTLLHWKILVHTTSRSFQRTLNPGFLFLCLTFALHFCLQHNIGYVQ